MNGFDFESLNFVESLYARYRTNPDSLESSWRGFFTGWEWGALAKGSAPEQQGQRVIEIYRRYGHLTAHLRLLGVSLDQERMSQYLKLPEVNQEALFQDQNFCQGKEFTYQELFKALQNIYSSRIGIEYIDCHSKPFEQWMQSKIEPKLEISFSQEEKIGILKSLIRAEGFEQFLHTKYVGQKRFSLEGGETLIPMMERIVKHSPSYETQEIIIGMAHRGRLSVLANILHKPIEEIFLEFEDSLENKERSGDVKYHKGFRCEYEQEKISVELAYNPSHLESVDPVVLGMARGKKTKVLPILIHGDASFSGQGVIYELLQMGKLSGYQVGGTLHIVINNQIGFTANPEETRSTFYCTDIAKTFGIPVFHVSAEDPEAALYAVDLALEIRNRFSCDVFIDLVCTRKYGHNEGDEPFFTNPLEYEEIRKRLKITELYSQKLVQEGVMTQEGISKEIEGVKDELQKKLEAVHRKTYTPLKQEVFKKQELLSSPTFDLLMTSGKKLLETPQGFNLHPKLHKLLQERVEMIEKDLLDWAMGEYLAFATLLMSGIPIRLSGQDSKRGTFSHRHGVLIDQKQAGVQWSPLSQLGGASFEIYNSLLSEMAVLGFEFGYSISVPRGLTIWEAQYGDFANGAQIIIDQFLSSSDQKWRVNSNLVLMLPHGYEGQGPEHSSGRIERFLQLSAQNNFYVCNCTTPAQLFHLLRRQVTLDYPRPLILFTPKALLRNREAVSSCKELIEEKFEEVLDDPRLLKEPEKLIFCSGKIYYDLLLQKPEKAVMIRIEQLYPLNEERIAFIGNKYSGVKHVIWVQEEPQNMGAWCRLGPQLQQILSRPVVYVGRPPSASPAVGSFKRHTDELNRLIQEALE